MDREKNADRRNSISQAKIFWRAGICFIVGIFWATILPATPWQLASGGILMALVLILAVRKKWRILFLAVSFFLGWGRYLLAEPGGGPGNIQYYIGREAIVTGFVADEPDKRATSQKLTVSTPLGKILISTSLYPDYEYGDRLEIGGRLEAPGVINDFDYAYYLARYDIYAVNYLPQIKKIGEEQTAAARFYRALFRFKIRLKNLIDCSLREPAAGLANALILGYKRTVSDDYLNKFSIIGLSHMIAISGTHITIMAAIILDFLLFFGFSRRSAFYGTLTYLILYTILTGLQASAIRALIMGGLVLWAQYLGRMAKMQNTLITAGVLTLAFNPRLLGADLGWQLSFLAIIALIYVYPLLTKCSDKFIGRLKTLAFMRKSDFWPKKIKIIADIFNITLACQILSWPLLAIGFQRVSLIAPLANLAILWVFDFLMVMLLAALAASWFLPAFSIFFFWPSFWLLQYIYVLTDWFAAVPGAAVPVNFSWGGAAIYYILLGLFLKRRHDEKVK